MLCSTGSEGLATFEQIADAMASVDDPVACCQRLVGLPTRPAATTASR